MRLDKINTCKKNINTWNWEAGHLPYWEFNQTEPLVDCVSSKQVNENLPRPPSPLRRTPGRPYHGDLPEPDGKDHQQTSLSLLTPDCPVWWRGGHPREEGIRLLFQPRHGGWEGCGGRRQDHLLERAEEKDLNWGSCLNIKNYEEIHSHIYNQEVSG